MSKPSKVRLLATTVLVVAIALFLWGALVFLQVVEPAPLYGGEGALIDHGWGHGIPRFEVRLPAIALNEDTSRSFAVPELPVQRWELVFELPRGGASRILTTVIDLTIGDSNGQPICRAVGALSDSMKTSPDLRRPTASWDVNSSSRDQSISELRSPACWEFSTARCHPCTVTVALRGTAAQGVGIQLVPWLRGGGWVLM